MTRRRPIIVRSQPRVHAKAAADAQAQAALAWAEDVVGQALQDLERPDCRIGITDGLRALARVLAQQLLARLGATLAGCVLFAEGARILPGWRPEGDSMRAVAEAAFKSEAA